MDEASDAAFLEPDQSFVKGRAEPRHQLQQQQLQQQQQQNELQIRNITAVVTAITSVSSRDI